MVSDIRVWRSLWDDSFREIVKEGIEVATEMSTNNSQWARKMGDDVEVGTRTVCEMKVCEWR